MRLTALPKTILWLALLLTWGLGAPPAWAQHTGRITVIVSDPFVQTVNVRTPRGNYTATFAQDTVVYPDGSASGVLTLTDPNGVPQSYLVTDGSVRFIHDTVPQLMLLRARGPDGEMIIVSRPDADASEPCRIYDVVGTQVNARLHFVGAVRVAVVDVND